jgi:hypothetical protein
LPPLSDRRGFPPLPGLRRIKAQDLQEGDIRDLHAVYGGLGSGRLVIAGAPGSGKSGAAVLLVLAALRHRQSVPKKARPKVQVPVLFTAQEWDPVSQRLQDWLALRMQETYRMFTGKAGALSAAALIAAGRVSVILDGLDEIAEGLRPIAMQALNQQAVFRVVVLARTAEMASAASQRGMLEGAAAVELQDVDPATVAEFLRRVQLDPPPDGWRDLIDHVHTAPGNSLAQALGNPLTLTLVRDTYPAGDNVRKLLELSDAADGRASEDDNVTGIVDYLLDRVLPAAYARRPGNPQPRYDLQTAQNALRQIAAQMYKDSTRDLEWWRIHRWAPRMSRVITVGVIAGIVTWVVAGVAAGFWPGLLIGAEIGALVGFLVWHKTDPRYGFLSRKGRLQLRYIFRRGFLLPVLVVTPLGGLGIGILIGVQRGVVAGLVTGLVLMLGMTALFGYISGFSDSDSTGSLSPLASWRSDSRYGLVSGVVGALLVGLMFGVGEWRGVGHVTRYVAVLENGLGFGLGFGLILGLISFQTWASALVFIQLAGRWHTPMRLMRFLDDACERNVLRRVGPVYQFRHARLQDRLAAQACAPVLDRDPSHVSAT